MAHESRKKSMLKKYGLKGVNKAKRTPSHPTKSHVVLAQEGHKLKLIRFGQQGKRVGTLKGTAGKPKKGESARMKENHLKQGTPRILLEVKCQQLGGQIR